MDNHARCCEATSSKRSRHTTPRSNTGPPVRSTPRRTSRERHRPADRGPLIEDYERFRQVSVDLDGARSAGRSAPSCPHGCSTPRRRRSPGLASTTLAQNHEVRAARRSNPHLIVVRILSTPAVDRSQRRIPHRGPGSLRWGASSRTPVVYAAQDKGPRSTGSSSVRRRSRAEVVTALLDRGDQSARARPAGRVAAM